MSTPTTAEPPANAPRPLDLERIGFMLPDFVRISWASDTARGVWEERLRRATLAWQEIEWRAVAAHVRPCGITTVAPEDLASRAALFAEHDLAMLPLEVERLAHHGGIESASEEATRQDDVNAAADALKVGEQAIVRVAIGTPETISMFQAAWEAGDDDRLSDLLGVPACCREFLFRVHGEERLIDPTWPWATSTREGAEFSTNYYHGGKDATRSDRAIAAKKVADDNQPGGSDGAGAEAPIDTVSLDLPPEANLLWRWAGVRAMPHQPCCGDCAESLELARRCLEVGRAAGYSVEVDWILDILSWPAEWSVLHGIAEVKTPVLRVSTRTDATGRKYAVRWLGEAYPLEGAQGLRFPYQGPAKPIMSTSRGQRRALAHAGSAPVNMPDWYHEENGFTSRSAMDASHRPLIEAADRALAPRDGVGAVLDLGCGNGALLKKLRDLHPGIVPFGVDIDDTRTRRAAYFFPHERDHFVAGDLGDPNSPVWAPAREGKRRYAVALLMPGRLIEAKRDDEKLGRAGTPEAREPRLRQLLLDYCDELVVYAYGDWVEKYGGLANLLTEAGLEPLEEIGRRPAVRARLLS